MKEPMGNAGDAVRCECDPRVRKFPLPVFWPGESHRQRSLAGYSPWGCEESDTTEMTKQARREDDTNREVNDRVPRG